MSESEPIVISGKIAVKGNEPRTWLCLTTDSGKEYRLVGDLEPQLRAEYQQQVTRLQGKRTNPSDERDMPIGFEVLVINPASP